MGKYSGCIKECHVTTCHQVIEHPVTLIYLVRTKVIMSFILASQFKEYAFCRLRKALQFVRIFDEEVTAYIRFMTQKGRHVYVV